MNKLRKFKEIHPCLKNTYFAWVGDIRSTYGEAHPTTKKHSFYGKYLAFINKENRDLYVDNYSQTCHKKAYKTDVIDGRRFRLGVSVEYYLDLLSYLNMEDAYMKSIKPIKIHVDGPLDRFNFHIKYINDVQFVNDIKKHMGCINADISVDVSSDTFTEACYNDNSLDELHIYDESCIDHFKMDQWGIDKLEFINSIYNARAAKLIEIIMQEKVND